MIAQDLSECGLQQMGCRVMGGYGKAPVAVNGKRHLKLFSQDSLRHFNFVQNNLFAFNRGARHLCSPTVPANFANIPNLPARFCIKRSFSDKKTSPLTGKEFGDFPSRIIDQTLNLTCCRHFAVTDKFSFSPSNGEVFHPFLKKPDTFAFTRRSRFLPLVFHLLVKTRLVKRESSLQRDIPYDIERKSECIIQFENKPAGNTGGMFHRQPRDFLIEHGKTVFQGLPEPFLLVVDHFDKQREGIVQVRIGLGHLLDDDSYNLLHERFIQSEMLTVANRTAHNPPQYISPSFVGRQDPVRNQKSCSPGMIGNYPHRRVILTIFAIGFLR
ncbi:MAG: hypothetical protein ACD_75C02449G0001 [uncultured bacterium]|nr:MAG: hypothetical protein ACD_75C02449G0001 [uncultured bacterium]